LVTPYFDPNFSMNEFKEGAKQAAILIANSLAEGDLDQVAAVVTPECLNMLQKNIRFGVHCSSTDHVNLY